MPTELEREPASEPPVVYQIQVKGQLGCEWAGWFDGLEITPDGCGGTLITGRLADQAALYGLLKKVRDLGLPLVSVNPLGRTGRRD